MKLNVLVTSADYRFQIDEWLTSFIRAVQYARINLVARHKIDLNFVELIDPWTAEVSVTLPDGFDVGNFNPGNRLRGIPLYMLKNNPELNKNKIGNRLFLYRIKEQCN